MKKLIQPIALILVTSLCSYGTESDSVSESRNDISLETKIEVDEQRNMQDFAVLYPCFSGTYTYFGEVVGHWTWCQLGDGSWKLYEY
jgi:hypothetical protein